MFRDQGTHGGWYGRAVGNVLVLWDIDYTLINAGGSSTQLYGMVFRQLFGRELHRVAPMAGRTDRAIILHTLERAGVSDPQEHVEAFLAGLADQAPGFRALVAERGHALPGAAAALAALAGLGPAHAVQSVVTGNIRPLAEAKLGALGMTGHLDLDIGAYGDHHEIRAELVHLARRQRNPRLPPGLRWPGGRHRRRHPAGRRRRTGGRRPVGRRGYGRVQRGRTGRRRCRRRAARPHRYRCGAGRDPRPRP